MNARIAAMIVASALAPGLVAQPTGRGPLEPPSNGPRHADSTRHALVGGTIHVQPGASIVGTVLMRDGRIERVLTEGEPPEGYRVHDATGLHLYAAFIDAFVEVDAPQPAMDWPGAHWSASVTPQRAARDGAGIPERDRERLRKLGFGAAAMSPRGGVFRGRADVVSLAKPDDDPSVPRPPTYRADAYSAVSLERVRGRSGGDTGRWPSYPNSQMGAIALVRQTLIDAAARRPTDPPSFIDALAPDLPLAIDVRDELESLRAAKIAREFGRRAIIIGSGREYRRLDAIREDGLAHVVPLALTKRPDVSSLGAADSVELRELMDWEQSPTNPRRLAEAGVPVAITASKLPRGQEFMDNLRAAIGQGLTEEHALAMLTTTPARLLGVGDLLGTIERGRVANIIVADGPIFAKKSRVLALWIDGVEHTVNQPPDDAALGTWAVTLADGREVDPASPDTPRVVVERRDPGGVKVTVKVGDKSVSAATASVEKGRLRYVYDSADLGTVGMVIDEAVVRGETMFGGSLMPGGVLHSWRATRLEPAAEPEPAEADEPPERAPDLPGYPFGAYAVAQPAPAQTTVIEHATVWTSGPAGIIDDGAVVLSGGKIAFVGPASELPAWLARVRLRDPIVHVDARGRHLTPGLIDCHSHTGISGGVNESGQAITAEVRIEDVTDPDDISWYRQLASGITTVNSLHGSANAIGGQNCVNKVRWGVTHPDQMHFDGAPKGIKFALGENPRGANWSGGPRTRYPQTRMGVEALIRDRLVAAREYLEAGGLRATPGAPRRDLELEALAEVVAGRRLVHAHSYRQDEILMLARVAGDFGFRIGTYQHGLECYKVADEVRESSLGASLFADWWAYKVEVQDAIPQAGPILHERGVVTSYNSDSDELVRRMNVEAAKAVKYGGVPRAEALKFVTINPAIQLGIEARVGSIEVGKDADVALWSGDPLSSMSRCEATWVDGAPAFSLERDREIRDRIARERERLVQKALADQHAKKSRKPKPDEANADEAKPDEKAAPPEDPGAAVRRAHLLDRVRRGLDPASHLCGECGMEVHR